MRNILELLKFLKEYLDSNFKVGLCNGVYELKNTGKISVEEKMCLLIYIFENKPKELKKEAFLYWWLPGNKQPRMEWLDEHIKLNKNLKNT